MAETDSPVVADLNPKEKRKLRAVIAASSAGTLIEWYDFYIFGSLAVVLAAQFFPNDDKVKDLISTLGIYVVGFVVRPFGALVFGRLGDLVGRKHAFLVTLLMMGSATFAIGLVPGFHQIGWAAPVIVLLLRVIQGLALGGEYGGAATYVAEHSPDHKRGYYTSFIQTTATLGLLFSIIVIIGGQIQLGKEAFESWGWRIPFLLSSILVVFSYLIRRKMEESPLFSELKAEGKQAKSPLKESFGDPANRKLVLLALLGATAGQGVVWYTGQFYALLFLQSELKVDKFQANMVVAIALIAATPLFIFFGSLSDKIGRKKIMMLGCLLAACLFLPIFGAMTQTADVGELETVKSEVKSPLKTSVAVKDDKAFGVKKGDQVTESATSLTFSDGATAVETTKDVVPAAGSADAQPYSKTVISEKKLTRQPLVNLTLLVFILVMFVTMVYGPIAAFLVELFPTRIRYSAMSLPYHIGNGVFGGLVPLIATTVVFNTGNSLAGLYYPIGIAALTFVVGSLFLPDRRGVKLRD